MPQVEIGILSFAPKGYTLAKKGERFGGNTSVFVVVNMGGRPLTHWMNAVSHPDGIRTFLEWFSKDYPRLVPPFRGDIYIFWERKALSN